MNTISNNLSNLQGSFQIPPRPKREASVAKASAPYIQKIAKNVSNPVVQPEKQNNLKFLESVTKIYEQSGREDLAIGLKNSISKTKQKI